MNSTLIIQMIKETLWLPSCVNTGDTLAVSDVSLLEWALLYLHALYLHQERVLSAKDAMLFRGAQIGQTEFYTLNL